MIEFKKFLTTIAAPAVKDNQNSRTAQPAGRVLLEDHHLLLSKKSTLTKSPPFTAATTALK